MPVRFSRASHFCKYIYGQSAPTRPATQFRDLRNYVAIFRGRCTIVAMTALGERMSVSDALQSLLLEMGQQRALGGVLRVVVDRLAEDHANAQILADAVRGSDGISLDPPYVDTNMIIFRVEESLATAPQFSAALKEAGVVVLAVGPQQIRSGEIRSLQVAARKVGTGEIRIDEYCSAQVDVRHRRIGEVRSREIGIHENCVCEDCAGKDGVERGHIAQVGAGEVRAP